MTQLVKEKNQLVNSGSMLEKPELNVRDGRLDEINNLIINDTFKNLG